MSTNEDVLEGSWDEVMVSCPFDVALGWTLIGPPQRIIGQCHAMLHANGVVRIQSDIRVGTRTDKKQSFDDKVAAVRKILNADEKAVEESNK